MAASVTKLYLHVIKDVVEKVRKELESEEKEEDAAPLDDLQQLWEKKIFDSGAVPQLGGPGGPHSSSSNQSTPLPSPFQSLRAKTTAPANTSNNTTTAPTPSRPPGAASVPLSSSSGAPRTAQPQTQTGTQAPWDEEQKQRQGLEGEESTEQMGREEEETDELSLGGGSGLSLGSAQVGTMSLEGKPQQYLPRPSYPAEGSGGGGGGSSVTGIPGLGVPEQKQQLKDNARFVMDMNSAPPEEDQLARGGGQARGQTMVQLEEQQNQQQQVPAVGLGIGLGVDIGMGMPSRPQVAAATGGPGGTPGMVMGVGLPVGMSMGMHLPMQVPMSMHPHAHVQHPYYMQQGPMQGQPLLHPNQPQHQQHQQQHMLAQGDSRKRQKGADGADEGREGRKWTGQGYMGYIPQDDGSADVDETSADEVESPGDRAAGRGRVGLESSMSKGEVTAVGCAGRSDQSGKWATHGTGVGVAAEMMPGTGTESMRGAVNRNRGMQEWKDLLRERIGGVGVSPSDVPQVDGGDEDEDDDEGEEEEAAGNVDEEEDEEDYNAPTSPLHGDEGAEDSSGGGERGRAIAVAEEDDEETLGAADDDDDDDEDSRQMMSHEGDKQHKGNLVMALYDKVTRAKNRWKCVLMSGVMHFGGKDFVFNKANGEFEF